MEQVEHFARIAIQDRRYKLVDLTIAINTAAWGDKKRWREFMDQILPNKKKENPKPDKIASKQDMEALKKWSKGKRNG